MKTLSGLWYAPFEIKKKCVLTVTVREVTTLTATRNSKFVQMCSDYKFWLETCSPCDIFFFGLKTVMLPVRTQNFTFCLYCTAGLSPQIKSDWPSVCLCVPQSPVWVETQGPPPHLQPLHQASLPHLWLCEYFFFPRWKVPQCWICML